MALSWRGAALLLATAALAFGSLHNASFFTTAKKGRDLQIRPGQPGQTVPDGFYVYQKLHEKGIRVQGITPAGGKGLLIQLEKPQQQEAARRALRTLLPKGIIITPANYSRHTYPWSRSETEL